ncbi:MAG: hypothetical protein AAFU41_05780 [Pseudomonadota bacterium]
MQRIARLLCLALACLALSACYERHEWRQKLTVVVDTPDGKVSGSAVVQVNATYWGQLPPTGTEVEYDIRGEATVVEVAPGRYLFVLLGGSAERFKAYSGDRFRGMKRQEWLREIPRQTEPVTIPLENAPMMVTFLDINDPASVREVDPENIAEVFGAGFNIERMTLEVTDDPVTAGTLEPLLNWWFREELWPDQTIMSLQLPDDSPRGWRSISRTRFWSLDLLFELREKYDDDL